MTLFENNLNMTQDDMFSGGDRKEIVAWQETGIIEEEEEIWGTGRFTAEISMKDKNGEYYTGTVFLRSGISGNIEEPNLKRYTTTSFTMSPGDVDDSAYTLYGEIFYGDDFELDIEHDIGWNPFYQLPPELIKYIESLFNDMLKQAKEIS